MYEDEDLQEIHEDIVELNEDISDLRRDLNNISASVEGSGENVTLNQTAEARFKKPPLPMGNSEQESTTGRNLLPTPEVKSQTINGVTISRFEDGTITIKGTPTAQMDVKFNFEESTFSAGSYIHFRNNFSTYNFAVSFRKDGVNKIAPGLAPLNNIYQILEDITVNQMVVLCNNDAVGTAYDITLKPSIELTNEVTEYEKYTNGASPNPDYPQTITNVTGDVEVKVQNKNLFDASERTFDSTYNGDFVLIKDRNSKWYGYIDISKIKFPLTISTFIYNSTSNISDTNLRISLKDKNKKDILFRAGTSITSSNKKSVVTILQSDITDEMKYLSIGIRVQDGGYTENTQIEQNTVATDYTPRKSQAFTFPLGDEKLMLGDYLADDGIHHIRKQVTFDGSELIQRYGEGTYSFSVYSNKLNNLKRVSAELDVIFCNKLLHTSREGIWINRNKAGNNLICQHLPEGNSGYVLIIANNYTEPNELKSYLAEQYASGTPVMVEYLLEEEVIVPYTSAQQEVYNQIKQAISYDEQTNISSNTIALFNVKAFRNMNTSIESLQSRIELLKGRS